MKVFAIVGLVGLVCAENGNNAVNRRRLALEQCVFADNQNGPHNPNYMGTFTWDIDEATGEVDDSSIALNVHDYKCCLDHHPGWDVADELQQACDFVTSDACVAIAADAAAADEAAAPGDGSARSTSFFSVGYVVADGECDTAEYADNCRDHVQCDTENGYSGTADLMCAADQNGEFALRGCARGDVGTLGLDLTSDVLILAPNTYPPAGSNPQTTFAQCAAAAQHHNADGLTAGNGGCDLASLDGSGCNPAYMCGVMPSWDGDLEVSDDDDTWINPTLYKSEINEKCIADVNGDMLANEAIPDGTETEVDCVGNVDSNNDEAVYGGFDLYGDRFSCWRNMGGAVEATNNNRMNAFDLTDAVINAEVNAGIGITLYDYEIAEGNDPVNNYAGVWNDANGRGYGICDSLAHLDGCTAELSALMCEAYNKQLVREGALDTTGFCIGFELADRQAGIGKLTGNKLYPTAEEYNKFPMYVGFFSTEGADDRRTDDADKNGGYFKYVPITNCLETSTANCGWCASCVDGFVLTSEYQCEIECPDYQYSNNGVCTYRSPHCIDGDVDGNCDTCHADFVLTDGLCEEIGCTVPDPMQSALSDTLVGAVQTGAPACTAGQNLVPGNTCGIDCPTGTYSSDSGQSHVYSCPSAGNLGDPTIICDACTVSDCASCPNDPTCDACNAGFEVGAGGNSCDPKACLVPAVQVDHGPIVGTGSANTQGVAEEVWIGVFHQGIEHCLALVLADARCAGDYFSYNARGNGDCGCKPTGGTGILEVSSDAEAANIDYYQIGSAESAGACTLCPLGFAGTLGWNSVDEDWDTSPCESCEIANCQDCRGNAAECVICDDGYHVLDATKGACQVIGDCPYGMEGTVTWNQQVGNDVSACAASTAVCEDESQTPGECTDCADGFAGSVDWDYANQEWNNDQCHAVACPVESEQSPDCNECPPFHTSIQDRGPHWDDMFNEWVGCIASEFGFSGPSASWEGSVSADRYALETKTAESLHVVNGQYDAIKEEWVCDAGFGGEGCKQRLCPETVAFTSGTDGFTPSQSTGTSFETEAAMGTSYTFNNQHSYRECGGRGTCDFETGVCQCFPGFTGVGCRRTTCPNGCSGHGVCMNDDISNYHAAGNSNLPSGDVDINTWGNLWASDKFQGCRCDGGWGGNDCSLRQCPRGDDPETQCADDLGNDKQYIVCDHVLDQTEAFFKLRFTDQLGNRYNSRAVVIRPPTEIFVLENVDTVALAYTNAAGDSIQTALESLPNFAIPQLEVTPDPDRDGMPLWGQAGNGDDDYTLEFSLRFEIHFTNARNSGKQSLLEIVSDMKCESGVQPKFTNTEDPQCRVERGTNSIDYRENAECSNRGLCNRKTAECNCFDGYTGLSCDIIAQTY